MISIKKQQKHKVDLIIISDAKDKYFAGITQQAIQSALDTAKVNIIVMEQNKEVTYENTTTVHYDYDFNYNKVANHGSSLGSAEWIMIANNDVIFKENWLEELLKVNQPVVSPKCPIDSRQRNILENNSGYEIAKHFSGWCFMLKRKVWEEIAGFDEDFHFWYADNATIEQLKEKGYTPMLVVNSIVEHLGSKTLNSLHRWDRKQKTTELARVFKKKYQK